MFDFLKRKRSWANLDNFEGRETSSGFPVSERSVLGIPAVFACVRVLAESVAALPLLVYRKDAHGDRTRADGFSLYDLLHRAPNPMQTSFELREMLMGHLCLRGNAFAFIERYDGEVVALWPLHPDGVVVEVKGRELIYKYQNNGEEFIYTADEVLHIRGLSSDGVMGYSPLDLCRDTWGSAKATSDYAANYFRNGASPGGILTSAQQLNAQSMSNLRESWEHGYKGKGNAHKVAILDAGLEWKAIGVNPEQSQMVDSRKFDIVEIARIFRVPLNLIQDHERSTYSNVVEQNRSFLTHTLRPWLSRIEQAMERALLTEKERRRFNIEHLTADLLRANTKERFESYKIALESGFMSQNEIRRLENLNNIGPQGDEYGKQEKAPASPESAVTAS